MKNNYEQRIARLTRLNAITAKICAAYDRRAAANRPTDHLLARARRISLAIQAA